MGLADKATIAAKAPKNIQKKHLFSQYIFYIIIKIYKKSNFKIKDLKSFYLISTSQKHI